MLGVIDITDMTAAKTDILGFITSVSPLAFAVVVAAAGLGLGLGWIRKIFRLGGGH